MRPPTVLRPLLGACLAVSAPVACGGDGDGGSVSADDGASATGTGTPTTSAGTTDPEGSSGAAEASVGSSSGDATSASASASSSETAAADSSGSADASTGAADGDTTDAGSSSGGIVDDGIVDVTIIAHDDCTFTTMPASISVPEGTEFTVNWISSASSAIEFDIAKIDRFNAVPIILGLEPATSYHDEVRVWCGELFTGTFDFELRSCFEPQYIPVDCSA